MRSLPRGLGITVLALCAVLAALWAYRSAHHPPPVAQGSAASNPLTAAAGLLATPGQSQPAPAGARAAVPVPETVPDIHMPNLQGSEIGLRSYLGHPLIINFWATWCPPCRHEMPLLQQLWTTERPSGLQIVGIAVDSSDAVKKYLRQTTVSYPLLVGEDQGAAAAASFGIEPVLPFSVFADSRGQIVAVKIGELHRAEADYIISTVQAVSQNRETLPQARVAIAQELRQLAIGRAKHGDAGQNGDLGAAIGADR